MPAAIAKLEPNRRIAGHERIIVSKHCVDQYVAGQPIRTIADGLGRSYGFVHHILTEAGVKLRERGGAQRRRRTNERADGNPNRGRRSSRDADVNRTRSGS